MKPEYIAIVLIEPLRCYLCPAAEIANNFIGPWYPGDLGNMIFTIFSEVGLYETGPTILKYWSCEVHGYIT